MSDNVIPLTFRVKPRPQLGRWTVECISLAELLDVILEIAGEIYGESIIEPEGRRDQLFAVTVLAACSNALYTER